MSRRTLDLIHELADRESCRSLRSYLDWCVIDAQPEPKRFLPHADPFQVEIVDRLLPAFEYVAGVGPKTERRSFWIELSRGHDKTSLQGRLLNYLLAYSRKSLTCYAAACDSDQAKLTLDSMVKEGELNPWFGRYLDFQRKAVYGPGGRVEFIASDAKSSSGYKGDVFVCDEVTLWQKQDLWDILYSGTEKREAVFVVITNAGYRDSWQEKVVEQVKSDPFWWYYRIDGTVASWMNADRIAQMRKKLLPGEARRLIDNVWIDASEENGYLTREEVVACAELGKELGLVYVDRAPRWNTPEYVASIDYAPKKDRTALCVLHNDPREDRVVVDRLDVLQGSPTDPVLVSTVEAWCEEVRQKFNNPTLVVDPYQMEGTCQKLELNRRVERFESRGGKRNYEMAELLRTLVVNKRIAWYPGAGTLPTDTLEDELSRLVTRRMPYGYRFDHESGRHDDRAVAIGMASIYAVETVSGSAFIKTKPNQPTRREDRTIYGEER